MRRLLVICLLVPGLLPAAVPPSSALGPTSRTAAAESSPQSAILFVFSDGLSGVYEHAFPALAERGWSGLALVPTANVGLPGRMTVEQLDALDGAGWDVASHLDEGGDPLQMPREELYSRLVTSRQWLVGQGFLHGARSFGPPGQRWQRALTPLALQAGYEVVAVGLDKGGVLPGTLMHSLASCASNAPLELVSRAIWNAVNQPGTALHLAFHNVVQADPPQGDSDVARLREVIDLVEQSGLPVRTMSDLLEETGSVRGPAGQADPREADGSPATAGTVPETAESPAPDAEGVPAGAPATIRAPQWREGRREAPAPAIVVQAPPLEAGLCPDGTALLTLSVCNQGGAMLQWAAVEEPALSWLAASPAGGKVRSTECATVTVGFDAGGMAPGSYGGVLRIESNDPATPLVALPAALAVQAPVSGAAFAWWPDPPEAGQEVTFQGTAGGQEPIDYGWQFGDGATAGGPAVTHTFALGGAYTVAMHAANACGAQQVQREVQVLAAGIAVSGPPLEAWLCTGETATLALEVCDVGTAPLRWTAAETADPPPAGGPRLLLLNADLDGRYGSLMHMHLEAMAELGPVDLFDAYAATPALDQLEDYDVVITWPALWYADPVVVGDVLADYVDRGGKVIHLAFSTAGGEGNLRGRFLEQNYAASVGGPSFAESCLGAYDAEHPLMAGVTELCDSYRLGSSQVTPGSTALAWWQDGEVLLAAKDDRSVVSIGAYVGHFGQWTGQMPALIRNAALWLSAGDIYWLWESPRRGTVLPGECAPLAVQFDTRELPVGSYAGQLSMESNDPATPQVLLPVTLTVQPECCEPPRQVEFRWEPAELWAGRQVTFQGQAEGWPPPHLSWDLGDGTTGGGQTVVHSYAEPGGYAVALSAGNQCGEETVVHALAVEPSTVMHVAAFKMRYRRSGTKNAVSGSLTIRDRNGAGVWNALLAARWTLPDGQTSVRSKLSDAKGQVFLSVNSPQTGVYELCVLDMTKQGWTYDPSQNYRTCAQILVP